MKWATCNIGANSPEEYGEYYAWGETEIKNEYSTDNCLTFAIENSDIKLSNEHKQYGWFTYDDAYKKLEYDSNKTALWELNQRLLNSDLNK